MLIIPGDRQISEKKIRQEEIAKLQNQAGHLTDAQWQSQEEELRKEMLQQIECHTSNLQQKESEWAEKIKRQTEMSKQLGEKCKNLKSLESKRLIELRNQLQEKQLETEQFWSKLTNTWAAEKISKDSKIDCTLCQGSLAFCSRRSLMAVQHSTNRRTLCQGSLLHSHYTQQVAF